jgi:predicted nucleic acid-binding protein
VLAARRAEQRPRGALRRDLGSVFVEPLHEALARAAGEALAHVRGSTSVDAIVMASAAQRGDAVYTSDPQDLARLRRYFPSVRVLGSG